MPTPDKDNVMSQMAKFESALSNMDKEMFVSMVQSEKDIPEPQDVPLTPIQQINKVLPKVAQGVSGAMAYPGLAALVENLNPVEGLAYMGIGPVEIHKATGALGFTGAEPQGMYNLGIRSPGSLSPTQNPEISKLIP